MVYELWDTASGNIVEEFPDEDAALAAVRELAVTWGAGLAHSLALGRRAAGGLATLVAEGVALLQRAQAPVYT